MKNRFKIAVCQMEVVDKKDINLDNAVSMINEAAKGGAGIVVLPEMFNTPYDTGKFAAYSEPSHNSRSLQVVSEAARTSDVYLIAGSIPESCNGKIYNSSFIFDRTGKIIDTHRKIHLFDIDIPDSITFNESDIITAGNKITVVETEYCKIGVAICYDIRFPELFRLMGLAGAELIVVPGAFNMTTGPAHWETLIRARAIDNQVYVAAASPSTNKNLPYVAYGHSTIVDPWGNIMAMAGGSEKIIFADIDLGYINKVRKELPVLKNRRNDIYNLLQIR